jgi:acyl carrier protein
MQSGLVDSAGLVELAAFVEREVGQPVDLSMVDLEQDWDTMDGILQFIERARSAE